MKLHGFIQNIRIYSLIDLVLLLYVIGARNFELLGGVFLWISFLLYLEWRHNHTYRAKVSIWLWLIFMALGLLLYPLYAGIGFLLFGVLYAEKRNRPWGIFSPFFRGLQAVALSVPFLGLFSIYTILIGLLTLIRNVIGDFRDTKKDKKEKKYTIPVALGFKKNIPHLHLIFVMTTTFIWWLYSDLTIILVPIMWIIPIPQ